MAHIGMKLTGNSTCSNRVISLSLGINHIISIFDFAILFGCVTKTKMNTFS